MLKELKYLPDDIIGVCGSGTVTQEDYRNVIQPILEAARNDARQIRLLPKT